MKIRVREKVLSYLMEADDFVSGEVLSQAFGVSRTSIWKAIKKLKEDGFIIHSVSNKGYRLIDKPSDLSDNLLLHELNPLGYDYVKTMESIDSTNKEAKRKADLFNGKGLFVASEQTAGRGRRGRFWESTKDEGIYMSLLIRPAIMPIQASMITLLAGMAVCRTIRDLYGLEASIKWPNDVVIHGKKVAGILTEMTSEIDLLNYIVVGIGINVGQDNFGQELEKVATSLGLELDKLLEENVENHGHLASVSKSVARSASRNSSKSVPISVPNNIPKSVLRAKEIDKHGLITQIIKSFEDLMNVFIKDGNLTHLQEEYNHHCINIGRIVQVKSLKSSFTGYGLGITSDGALQVKLDDGSIETVNAGEVSVRGIYGYV